MISRQASRQDASVRIPKDWAQAITAKLDRDLGLREAMRLFREEEESYQGTSERIPKDWTRSSTLTAAFKKLCDHLKIRKI